MLSILAYFIGKYLVSQPVKVPVKTEREVYMLLDKPDGLC